MAVFIPQDFSAKLAANQPAQLIFKQRGNGGTEGQIVASLVRGSSRKYQPGITGAKPGKVRPGQQRHQSQQIEMTVQQFIAQEASSPSVTVSETTLGSSPDPVNQFLPGIMTMFVLFAVNLTAQALVDERRKGTLERLLTTRLRIGELFTGKFLAYTARGFIQTIILLLLAYAVFRIFTPVSFLEALVLALIFAAACSTIGLIIGSLGQNSKSGHLDFGLLYHADGHAVRNFCAHLRRYRFRHAQPVLH